jgi:PKHD-type hydroxylase
MAGWTLNSDETEDWIYAEKYFTADECKKIIEMASKEKKIKGSLNTKNLIDESVRINNTVWLHPSQENNWIYEKLLVAIKQFNEKHFHFDLFGILESLQFAEYNHPNGKYEAHIDRGKNISPRKLSVSLQLSDENDYEGGDLELIFSHNPDKAPRTQGTVIVFPSYVLHRVAPVTSGTRYSLVAWVTGAPFK